MRHVRLSLAVPVAALAAVAGPAHALAAPFFDVAQTSVELRDGTAVIRFTERGLRAGEAVEVEASLSVAQRAVCVNSQGVVLFRSTSSASASAAQTYVADASGTVTGEGTLTADPGSVEAAGLPCTVQMTRSVTATVWDRDHNIQLTITP